MFKTNDLSLYKKLALKAKVIFALILLGSNPVLSQGCINGYLFVTSPAPTDATPITLTTCNWAGDYNEITGVVAGETYSFTSTSGCISISQNAGGPVIAFGTSPLNWVAPSSGTFYIHYNTDCAGCGTGSTCLTTTVSCLSCGGSSPCSTITNIVGCGTSALASMSGTGVPWDFTSCNGGTSIGTESIWSFTPVNSGTHAIDVTGITGGPIDMYWVDQAVGCSGTEANWNCIDEVSGTGTFGAMNWLAGTTYYILFDPETSAYSDITFNIDCPPPPVPATAGDCDVAIPICTDYGFQIDPGGYGTVDELCLGCVSNPSVNPGTAGNSGCALSGEINSTWFTINIAAGGLLEFSFGVDGGSNYYDWVIWPYSATACNDIFAGTLPPASCNWNGVADSYTGMANTLPPGADPSNFEDALTVNTGDAFVMVLSNWSSAISSVPLNFFGTADINCVPLPVELISFIGNQKDGINLLEWETAAEINCSHFQVEKSADGLSFSPFISIPGAGNDLNGEKYRTMDVNPLADITYYRLKQFDYDGNYKYSEIIAIATESTQNFKVINAFPNPASKMFYIEVFTSRDDIVSLTLYDTRGTLLTSYEDQVSKGVNTLNLPVNELSKGVYLISIKNALTQESDIVRFTVE